VKRSLHRLTCCTLLATLFNAAADARSLRAKRLKIQDTDSLSTVADESVAEQVNDPASFLREASIETSIEHGSGPSHTLVEMIPTLALPLGQRFRFEGGIPVALNGARDKDDIELGDVYTSLAYIFYSSEEANYLADLRIDYPTGNSAKQAGQELAVAHFSLASVLYAFQEQGFLLIPKLEYRRSLYKGQDAAEVSALLGNLSLVYLWSEKAFLRGELILSLDEQRAWHNSGRILLEAGKIFEQRYSVALGYEFDAWGHEQIRNQLNFSLGYLF